MASYPIRFLSKNADAVQRQSHSEVTLSEWSSGPTAAVCTQTGFSEEPQAGRAREKDRLSHFHEWCHYFLQSSVPEDDGIWPKGVHVQYPELLQKGT